MASTSSSSPSSPLVLSRRQQQQRRRRSPPHHRHDGSSPLPLGMDWSPHPKKWEGRNTIWPHNPQTGWSYCVMIPSWIVEPEAAAHDSFLKRVIFYRIHVGIQSPEGVSSSHGIVRRFSDFLKLYSDLRSRFPDKDIPSAPPKNTLLRPNSSRLLIEQRRSALEDWMEKLLSDIDLSRSAPVASFLELETAARSSFEVSNEVSSEASSSVQGGTVSSNHLTGDSINSAHVVSKSKDVTVNHSSRVFGNGVLEESGVDKSDQHHHNVVHLEKSGHGIEESIEVNGSEGDDNSRESNYDDENDQFPGITRKASSESIASDISSLRGSELSTTGNASSLWDGSADISGLVEPHNLQESFSSDAQPLNGTNSQIIFPVDQRQKLTRLLVTMQRRVLTAKTDTEDLISRLNQETAVKEYLATKVKDLEVELEATKQKGKETLQEALLAERERITQMQWDMDELRRKCSEMESNLKNEKNEKTRAESEKTNVSDEKEQMLLELKSKQEELKSTRRHLEEVEAKLKADVKVLVKEVKFLRNSQEEMRKTLHHFEEENTELQKLLDRERQRSAHANESRKRLLQESRILRDRLQECSINVLAEEDKLILDSSSLSDALDLLATSDNRIGLLLAEAQLLARDEDEDIMTDADDTLNGDPPESLVDGGSSSGTDEEVRKVVTNMFIDNALLRKHLNHVLRCALNTTTVPDKQEKEELQLRRAVLQKFLER